MHLYITTFIMMSSPAILLRGEMELMKMLSISMQFHFYRKVRTLRPDKLRLKKMDGMKMTKIFIIIHITIFRCFYWSSNNCLRTTVYSCAQRCKVVLLRTVFCSYAVLSHHRILQWQFDFSCVIKQTTNANTKKAA